MFDRIQMQSISVRSVTVSPSLHQLGSKFMEPSSLMNTLLNRFTHGTRSRIDRPLRTSSIATFSMPAR